MTAATDNEHTVHAERTLSENEVDHASGGMRWEKGHLSPDVIVETFAESLGLKMGSFVGHEASRGGGGAAAGGWTAAGPIAGRS